jgi:hypothetical protein
MIYKIEIFFIILIFILNQNYIYGNLIFLMIYTKNSFSNIKKKYFRILKKFHS